MAFDSVVVIVDDDEGMSRAMARMIDAGGMTPVVYGSAEALLAAGPVRAACIIIDVQLPGLDGAQLFQRLDAHGNAAPVVFVSASEEAEARIAALAGPPREFLAKPFSGHVLLETVRRLMRAAA